MNKVEIVDATPAHIPLLVAGLRERDRKEVEALGMDPYTAVESSLERSVEAYSAFVEGSLICMFGLAPPTVLSEMAVPWLLSTTEVPDHRREFARRSKEVVQSWSKEYPLLMTYVDERYELAVRWLTWLGFREGERIHVGENQVPFRRVELRA